MEYSINYLAVFVSAVLVMGVGALWYSPMLFGKSWMKLTGVTMGDAKKGSNWQMYVFSFVAFLLMALGLAFVLDVNGVATVGEGLFAAFWVWLPFMATVTFINYMYQMRKLQLFLIDSGYMLVSVLVMSVVLSLWG